MIVFIILGVLLLLIIGCMQITGTSYSMECALFTVTLSGLSLIIYILFR
jgi:hypothetical protein